MTLRLRILALTVAVVSVAALIATAVLDSGGTTIVGAGTAWAVPNIAVGSLLTFRRPRLVMGWIFALIGLLVATGTAAEAMAHAGMAMDGAMPWWAVFGAWYGEWYWIPMIYATVIFVPMLFPNGAPPPSRFFRRATFAIVTALVVFTVLAALQEQLHVPNVAAGTPPIPNPIGIPGLGDIEEGLGASVLVPVTVAALITAFSALIVRFRRSRGVERQQLKWFTSACAALIVVFMLQGMLDALFRVRFEFIDLLLFALPPLAAAVAIFRYRLYAIDRIISRTVTYALVTALVIGVYIGGVALMSAAIDPIAGESPLAVAVATLAAAAVFRPARRRIQNVVDRRFNRARYDAERTLDDFRDRVRSDVDLDRLCVDLVSVADDALQPRSAVVWLRGEEAPA